METRIDTELTLVAIEAPILAIMMILPPCPKRTICRPAACAVNIAPFRHTSTTWINYESLRNNHRHKDAHLAMHVRWGGQRVVERRDTGGRHTDV